MKRKNFFLIGAGVILLAALLFNLSSALHGIRGFFAAIAPFFGGFAFAYLLNQPVLWIEKCLARCNFFHERKTFLRITAVVLVTFLLFLLLLGLCAIILPQLMRNLMTLFSRIPTYYQEIQEFFGNLCAKLPFYPSSMSLPDFNVLLHSVYEYCIAVSDQLANAGADLITSAIQSLTDLSVALISGIYLMIFKENFIAGLKKCLFAIFPQKPTERFIDLARDSNRIFLRYLYSKLLTSVAVGVLTFLAMLIFSLPYAPLICAIVTVFNMIPFFGPVLGAIPGVLLLLLNEPRSAFTFILITLAVQFLDNQFLTPKIVGDSIGMNPFWVLFSIVLGGSIGGIGGMFFGVPLFAVLLAVLRMFVNRRLSAKGFSTHTADYHTPKTRK